MILRKTFAPEIIDAVVARVESRFAEDWDLKLVQTGGLEWLYAPDDLDEILPCVLVELESEAPGTDPKLGSDARLCTLRMRFVMPMQDAIENPKLLIQRLRSLHDEFLREGMTLAVSVSAGESEGFGFRRCRARRYEPDPDLFALLGVMAGTVTIEVEYSADPYTPLRRTSMPWLVYENPTPGPHQVGDLGVFVAGEPTQVGDEVAERLMPELIQDEEQRKRARPGVPGFRLATPAEVPEQAPHSYRGLAPLGKRARAVRKAQDKKKAAASTRASESTPEEG